MEWERLAKIAGTPHNIYSTHEDVRAVFDIFCQGYITYFNINPIEQRTMFTSAVLRGVQSFISDYGIEDAKLIVNYVFDEWKGRNRKTPVGKELFSKRFRWLTDLALTEAKASKARDDRWL